MQAGSEIRFRPILESARNARCDQFADAALDPLREEAGPRLRHGQPANRQEKILYFTADDFVSRQLEGGYRGVIQIDETTLVIRHRDQIGRSHGRGF